MLIDVVIIAITVWALISVVRLGLKSIKKHAKNLAKKRS